MNKILNHVVAPRVPVWCLSLLGSQFCKGTFQGVGKGWRDEGVGFGDHVATRVECDYQASLLVESSFASELGNSLSDQSTSQISTDTVHRPETYIIEAFFGYNAAALGHANLVVISVFSDGGGEKQCFL